MELDLVTFGVFQNLSELALATAGILGLTGLIGKLLPERPETLRDTVLPLSAMVIGIVLAVGFQLQHEEPITIMGILFGILFGGTVTGLYTVTKQIKQA